MRRITVLLMYHTTPQTQISDADLADVILYALDRDPSLVDKLPNIKEFDRIKALAPDLVPVILGIAAGRYGKINCHGASASLIGLTIGQPVAINPYDMPKRLEDMVLNGMLVPRSLVCARIRDAVAHSGLLLTLDGRNSLVLHKGGYNAPFEVTELHMLFGNSNVESYSLH